jgi:hypothetical protein
MVPGDYSIRIIDRRRKIINGPVYDLATAQQLLKIHGLHVVNESADDDMITEFRRGLTSEDLKKIILTLGGNHYDDSEICSTSKGMTIDADGYTIYWNRTREIESMQAGQKTYIKFGFRDNNPKCLIVSIHPAKH